MLLPLSNVPRDYAWGSASAISDLLGIPATGRPEAELWLGAHPASPARVHIEGEPVLDAWIAENPNRALRGSSHLPFLLKVLAADKPLSLQVHPSQAQAQAGFERENERGLSLDDPSRNYRDDQHKPELIVALSEEFVALSGFRPLEHSVADLRAIVAAHPAASTAAIFVTALEEIFAENPETTLAWAVETLLRGGPAAKTIVDEFVEAAAEPSAGSAAPDACATIQALGAAYPGDSGVLIGALLNRVVLKRGEALYLPAGNVHAYLHGLGIEVMSSSDNVLRGGLTEKHVDVDELLRVADLNPLLEPRWQGEQLSPQLTRFAPPVDDFVLFHYHSLASAIGPSDPITLGVAAIVLCVSGEVLVSGDHGSLVLHRGEACFLTGDEAHATITGVGEAFLATSRG